MKVYVKKPDHAKTKQASRTLEGFFAWALQLCQRDETDRVMVETPDFRVTWDKPRARKPARKGKR